MSIGLYKPEKDFKHLNFKKMICYNPVLNQTPLNPIADFFHRVENTDAKLSLSTLDLAADVPFSSMSLDLAYRRSV